MFTTRTDKQLTKQTNRQQLKQKQLTTTKGLITQVNMWMNLKPGKMDKVQTLRQDLTSSIVVCEGDEKMVW